MRLGATVISSLSRAIARSTAFATFAGVVVPTPEGASAPESWNIPASRTKPGRDDRDARRRGGACPRGSRRRTRGGRTWSRCRGRRAASRPCRRARRSGRCGPRPSSPAPAPSSRAIRIGASRLTRSARWISFGLKSSRRPLAGSAALATRTSTSPASPISFAAAPFFARSETTTLCLRAPAGQRAWRAPRAPASRRELRTSFAPASASLAATAWPIPPVAPLSSTRFPSSSTRRNAIRRDACVEHVQAIVHICYGAAPVPSQRRIPPASEGGSGGTEQHGANPHSVEAQALSAPARQLTP